MSTGRKLGGIRCGKPIPLLPPLVPRSKWQKQTCSKAKLGHICLHCLGGLESVNSHPWIFVKVKARGLATLQRAKFEMVCMCKSRPRNYSRDNQIVDHLLPMLIERIIAKSNYFKEDTTLRSRPPLQISAATTSKDSYIWQIIAQFCFNE